MAGKNAIRVEGSIVAVLKERLFRVELPNGHQLTGFVKGRSRVVPAGLTTGGKVTLEVSPCDLSKGMIVEVNK